LFDGAALSPDVLAICTRQITAPGAAMAILNWYRAIRLRSSRALNLAQVIEVPTLVVWGEQDVALDPICLNGTEHYVRDLTVKRLPGVSHWVQQDAPQVVNELLQEFLA
jgi:pimeloyl-ACP methyl ester carboxylesterase